MKELYADLHVHTNFSDGAFSPEEAVQFAHKMGLSAISITDHDIVDGIPAAIREGNKLGVEVIPGIELSTIVGDVKTSEMHILGYFINWENIEFRQSLDLFRTNRKKRAYEMLDKFKRLGIALDEKYIFALSGNGSIGRLHFAKALIKQGFSANIKDAFQNFLGIGKPAYVPKLHIKPCDAIKMILRVGGVPVLAHPFYGHYSDRDLINGLIRDGLRGIEVWHSKHTPDISKKFLRLATETSLIATGGSDCHGAFAGESAMMGSVKIPYSAIDELRKSKSKIDNDNLNIPGN